MGILRLDSANSPWILSYTLVLGVDCPLYNSATGFVTTTGGLNPFGIPPQSSVPRGTLWFQAVPNVAAGATGALTVDLECSLDGGTTFAKVATGLALVTAGVSGIISANISGLGGNGKFRLNPTTVTLGTAAGFNVWAHLG